MPQIYRYLNLIFSFWSDDHLPPHVHVVGSDGHESVFDLIISNGILIDIQMRQEAGIKPLEPQDIRKAKEFIRTYYAQIVEKWFNFFVLGLPIKPIVVRKPISETVDISDTIRYVESLNKKMNPSRKKSSK